jgi:phage/plasmid-like protein (TIGR03299 family)
MSRETQEWLSNNVLVGFGEKPWHYSAAIDSTLAESIRYEGAIPVEDIRRRLFHWTAQQVPMQVETPFGVKEVPGHFAHIRSDNGAILGLASKKYAIHQFQDSLLGGAVKITGSGLGINSAGLLKGGAQGWVSVSLRDTFTTQTGVEFLSHLLCYGSHDGSLPTSYKLVNTLVVCDNTLGAARNEANRPEYRIRHTKNSALKIENAQQALGLIVDSIEETDAYINDLCSTPVSNSQFAKIVEALVAVPAEDGRGKTMAETKQADLHELWNASPMVAPWAGTLFGVVQAVNTHAHHKAIVRGADRWERNTQNMLKGAYDDLDANTLAVARRVLAN